MSSVTKTFAFAADAEGLTEVGLSALVGFAFAAGDGSPANGCVAFACAFAAGAETEQGAGGSFTWASAGVPTTATVNAVRIGAKTRLYSSAGFVSRTLALRLTSGGTPVCATDPLSLGAVDAEPAGWNDRPLGASCAVSGAYSSPSTSVDLCIELAVPSVSIGGIDYRVDSVSIEIDYTEAVVTGHTRTALPAICNVVAIAGGYARWRSRACPVATVTPGGGELHEYSMSGATLERRVHMCPVATCTPTGAMPAEQNQATGNVLHAQCRDASGPAWTTEAAVGSGARGYAAAVYIEPIHGCLYTRAGRIYWRGTLDPSDWSAATEVDTGIDGLVCGACVTDYGVAIGLVRNAASGVWSAIRSHGLGSSWQATGVVPITAVVGDAGMVAIANRIIVTYVRDGVVSHYVSVDGGWTWA